MKLGRNFHLDLEKLFGSIEMHCEKKLENCATELLGNTAEGRIHFDENASKMAIWTVQNVDPHTSWKHRIFQVGRALCRFSSLTSSSRWCWFCNYIRLLRTWNFRGTLKSIPQQLVSFLCLSILKMKFVFLVFSENYFAST